MRRIRPQLYIGPSVQPQDLPRLRKEGISAVLSLQQLEVDLPRAAAERMRQACAPHIEFHNIGIRDYDPLAVIAAVPEAVAGLHRLISDGHTVYMHCTEGINRAPSVALAYIVRHDHLAVDAALDALRGCDPGARPYAPLIEWLRRAP